MNSTYSGTPCLYLYQNHSFPKLGTLNMPQLMKIPNLDSSYQAGKGRLSRESQVGLYCCATIAEKNVKKRQQNESDEVIPRAIADRLAVCTLSTKISTDSVFLNSIDLSK